jgi:uncharacterized protein involved in response to NO
MLVAGGGAVTIWVTDAKNSLWEMSIASLCTLLALLGGYAMVAALANWWPWDTLPPTTDGPMGAGLSA